MFRREAQCSLLIVDVIAIDDDDDDFFLFCSKSAKDLGSTTVAIERGRHFLQL